MGSVRPTYENDETIYPASTTPSDTSSALPTDDSASAEPQMEGPELKSENTMGGVSSDDAEKVIDDRSDNAMSPHFVLMGPQIGPSSLEDIINQPSTSTTDPFSEFASLFRKWNHEEQQSFKRKFTQLCNETESESKLARSQDEQQESECTNNENEEEEEARNRSLPSATSKCQSSSTDNITKQCC